MSRRIILSRQYCTPFCNKSGIERFFSTFLFLAGNRLLRAHFELQCSYTLPKLSEVRTVILAMEETKIAISEGVPSISTTNSHNVTRVQSC